MDMDAIEEFSGSNDHMMIIKRKRTKRPRQSSPLSAVVTSSSSSDGGGGGDGGGGHEIHFLNPSIWVSSEISTRIEEDEDMANCLILLAQSGCSSRQVEQDEVKMERISSRRFTEMATTTGKAGIYVYECKTCNRTFPSFQALGGHRASHKKPKITILEEKKVPIITPLDDHHEEEEHEEEKFTRVCPPVSVQILANRASSQNGVNKPKIHECSICGSEFSSGQALGGHMRRHRNPTGNKGNMNIDRSTTEDSSSHDGGERPRNIRQLDLNLPAPPEDDDHNHDSKFQFSVNQQHLFSSPALVDCHY